MADIEKQSALVNIETLIIGHSFDYTHVDLLADINQTGKSRLAHKLL
jgi:hypothetical protein